MKSPVEYPREPRRQSPLLVWLLIGCVGVCPLNGFGAHASHPASGPVKPSASESRHHPHGSHPIYCWVFIECPVDNDQLIAAKRAVEAYQRSVQAHRRAPSRHRFISVRTRNPNSTQKSAYVKKRTVAKTQTQTHGTSQSIQWVDPADLKCVCVYDTMTNQFASSKCYVVGDLPSEGDTAVFQTYTTEYVGTGAGSAPKVEPTQ